MQTLVKKLKSPRQADRFVRKMAAKGWVLAGPVSRSGIYNKRYMVTMTKGDATAPEMAPPRPDK